MKVKLLQDSRREGKAGEIVDVSPERFAHLLSIGFAEAVAEARERAEAPAKQAAKTPEKKPAKAVKGSKK